MIEVMSLRACDFSPLEPSRGMGYNNFVSNSESEGKDERDDRYVGYDGAAGQ